MEKALFITHKNFINENTAEGGVKYCTLEYIELLKTGYDLNILKVNYNKSLWFKIKAKIGIDAYDEYNPSYSLLELTHFIINEKINKVFINLSNASEFAVFIKKNFPQHNIKIILCSHGNESGDFLHQSVRFPKSLPFLKNFFSTYRLGLFLKNELKFRLHFFDLVLTVSDIEKSIENWLGVKKVYMVPRSLKNNFLNWNPTKNAIGFVGDVSHFPNYFGLNELCQAISSLKSLKKINIYVVGQPCKNLNLLLKNYQFVHSLGYLDNDVLEVKASSWNYYLNTVFYYSKGVSTKLAKGMNWGLPVLSTPAGNRGYDFGEYGIPTFDNAIEMASFLVENIDNQIQINADKIVVENIVNRHINFEIHVANIKKLLVD